MLIRLLFRFLIRTASALVVGAVSLAVRLILSFLGFTWHLPQTAEAMKARVHCPRGCAPSPADGWWKCGDCSSRFVGTAFGRCPNCRHLPGWISCTRCGTSIRNPRLGP